MSNLHNILCCQFIRAVAGRSNNIPWNTFIVEFFTLLVYVALLALCTYCGNRALGQGLGLLAFLPHCMECRRSLVMRILSSVCQMRKL